jgi:ABC-type multidrug transport system ATPase subunit
MSELTVHENLLHSARIRLPSKWTEAEIQEHVNILIACLELTSVRNNRVGDLINPGISGGQRKRVSIGIELAAAPMALVLDEPTSGLDATSALAIMKLLKAICQQGVTVVCIIHQPRLEIFECLDRLLLLADGREVYFGRACDASEYFRTAGFETSTASNPADVIMDIVCERGQKYAINPSVHPAGTISNLISHWILNQHLYKEIAAHRMVVADNPQNLTKSISARGLSWHRQVYFCFLRSVKQQSRQLSGFILEIAVGTFAGLFIGLSVFKLEGLLFQGIFRAPFEPLSSAVNYTLVPQLGQLCCVAIGKCTISFSVRSATNKTRTRCVCAGCEDLWRGK